MANEMRDRLYDLLGESEKKYSAYYEKFIKQLDKAETQADFEKIYDGVIKKHDFFADHLIENGVVVPQWISVSDRLPDEEERVLVAVDSDKSDTKIDTDRMMYRQWVRWGMSVTHWMPLPEPPKKEGADK